MLDGPGRGAGVVLLPQQSGNLSRGLLYLSVEGGGGQTQRSVAQNDKLLGIVRGGYPHPVLFPAELIGGLLNVGVGGLRFLGVYTMDVVVVDHLAHPSRHR